MQISSIVDIVSGKLLNFPSISFITQIHTNARKINDGDLYISNNQDDIKLAISNGAFCIISDKCLEILDKEIAWIKVNDISLALVKLLRFLLSNKHIKSFYCDIISFDLLKVFSSRDDNIVFLSDDIKKDFELIRNSEQIDFLFSTKSDYLENLQPLTKLFEVSKLDIQNLTQHSLFYTTFSYKEQLFSRIKLPSMYINEFLSIVNFYKNPIDITKLKNFNHFEPVFIDKSFEIVDFGKSNKFILASKIKNKKEINFLKNEYDYAKIVIIDKFKDNEDLFKQIKYNDFNALYIVGKTIEEIKVLLNTFTKYSLSLSF